MSKRKKVISPAAAVFNENQSKETPYIVATDPYDSSLSSGAGYAINDDQITREIMSVQKITPDEIPTLTAEALAIGKSFQTNIGTIPTTWVAVVRMIPSIIKFFTESYPHIAVIVKEIKD